jgi:hypothetical protein
MFGRDVMCCFLANNTLVDIIPELARQLLLHVLANDLAAGHGIRFDVLLRLVMELGCAPSKAL